MTNSLQRRPPEEKADAKSLAPVIAIRPAPVEPRRDSRKISKLRVEEKMPLIYDKPIFKTKKYDPL